MSTKFFLTVYDQQNTQHQIEYHLADNPIAIQWLKKIKHISKVPLDRVYSIPNDHTETKQEINVKIANDIQALNDLVGKIYEVKDHYDQNDCNLLHAFTVSNQYNYGIEARDIFHRLHRQLHQLEMLTSPVLDNTWLPGEWGEKAGPITTMHAESPYPYYTLNMQAGNIYYQWAEFGKTPYRYWQDHDIDDVNNFLANCRPHMTFRPNFSVYVKDVDYNCVDPEFETWFAQYRSAWEDKYHADALSVYGHGGVLLAEPAANQFSNFAQIYSIECIDLG
jgi:hypothetical protein